MLLSMTGYGDARGVEGNYAVSVEARAVNNRYLKVVGKFPDGLAAQEGEIERRVRQVISRGTVTIQIRIDREARADDYRLNTVALASYWQQVQQLGRELHAAPPADLGPLLHLDGVVQEQRTDSKSHDEASGLALRVLDQALERLQVFRVNEGKALAADLEKQTGVIADQLAEIEVLAPQSVVDYRSRLHERIRSALADTSVTVEESHLVREVALFADRGDVNEEITRLHSHLVQFAAFLAEPSSAGRKLDFLSQELNREANTIGSKANHVGIARCVVEMKAAIEKIREVLQNVE